MTSRSMAERYDASAARYERWWAPVLAPTAIGLLDTADEALAPVEPTRILDLGAGTGTLTRAAVRRWPSARVTALDASRGMLAAAEAIADSDLEDSQRARVDLVVAGADRMPLPDGSFDLVVSSFVLQLVPDRGRVLREIRRVLRPGGTLAFVTWLAGRRGERWLPDDAFDDAVADVGIEEDEVDEESRSGDLPSVEAAVAQVRHAGFRDVRGRALTLAHDWNRESYLDFLELYDEWDLFSGLSSGDRVRLRRAAQRRLGRLRPSDFAWRVPVVELTATRP
ncbi:MAG TPA: class I SAM-dependent methyltransferase [Candidatus Limnocylindrales bacterium]|nr:class I SAM-dependent methyltransferase [Candidatus Limnocylindrales bacterium]